MNGYSDEAGITKVFAKTTENERNKSDCIICDIKSKCAAICVRSVRRNGKRFRLKKGPKGRKARTKMAAKMFLYMA
ncbi:CLUMA_CG015526, isoform A [Clunio marinus]|uniref:CLUMA_CG015526, isoform A n=1 Tax=Clunio marinus TaxID=568069 RepID=A0A1J1IPA7_9DIPT|nr:CLUMA_CG015526, isoform A [Clunio marinus]